MSVVSYSALASAWRIRTRNGDSAWISHHLSGLGPFASAALEHVRADVIDRRRETRPMLAAVAAGVQGRDLVRPPRLW